MRKQVFGFFFFAFLLHLQITKRQGGGDKEWKYRFYDDQTCTKYVSHLVEADI